MLRDDHLKNLDLALDSVHAMGGVKTDVGVLKRLVYADVDRIKASHAEFESAFQNAECSIEITWGCRTVSTRELGGGGGDDHAPMQAMTAARAGQVGWGIGHCWTWGNCWICISLGCRSPA